MELVEYGFWVATKLLAIFLAGYAVIGVTLVGFVGITLGLMNALEWMGFFPTLRQLRRPTHTPRPGEYHSESS